MIYPVSLYNFGKVCESSQMAGNILRALCKQPVALSPTEKVVLEMIKNDNTWMDERIAKSKKANAEKVAAWREKKREAVGVTDATKCNGYNGLQEVTSVTSGDVTDVTKCNHHYLPISLPSSLPTSKNNSRTEPDITDADAKAAAESAAGSDRVKKVNVYALADEDFFSGLYPTNTLFVNACGKGFWLKAIRQLGEDVCLEELNKFIHEVRAGEAPNNPAAVMSARLKKLGVK